MRNLIKICTKYHSKRSHVVAKSKNLLSSWCRKAAIGAFVFGALLVACGDDNSGKNAGGTEEDSGIVAIADKTVSGVSQKGPFVNGSSVTVQELDGESLAQTGASYEGKIKNDMGEFSVKVTKLASQYALLKANGFYRNEVTGEKSKSQVTLYALTDLSDRDEVNVNLLTHMEYERSLYLASEGLSVGKAKKQAESEVLASFGIEGDFASAEDLSIFGTDEGAAALLAVSVLMQGDLSEADFSERLANYAADIEQDGKWDDFITATVIADWASNRSLTGRLAAIRNNIAGWGLAADVPAFEKYVDRYWWQVYSLGFCDKDREGEVKAADNALSKNNGVHFICGDGAWRKATDIEKDTYKWKPGKDADVKNGDVVETNCYVFEDSVWRSGNEKDCSLKLRGCTALRQDTVGKGSDEVWYICDTQNWRKATDIEKDTYKWEPGKDADVKNGDVVKKNCYVFEDGAWRSGNEKDCSLKLRGCTALRQDTVGKGSDEVWYICDAKAWRNATDIEKDTATWGPGEFNGELRPGQINDDVIYAYYDSEKTWHKASVLDIDTYKQECNAFGKIINGNENANFAYFCYGKEWKRFYGNEAVAYGKLEDERDGQIYRTVQIGNQIWMAENLNYGKPNIQSILDCNDRKEYGLLYTWNAAVVNVCDNGTRVCDSLGVIQGLCPAGWHIPSQEEWNELDLTISHTAVDLQAKGFSIWSEATDYYGFSALPVSGKSEIDNRGCDGYNRNGDMTSFWGVIGGVLTVMSVGENYLNLSQPSGTGGSGWNNARSVRCIKDQE